VSNAPSPLDRNLAAERSLIRAELPELTFSGIYEYRVIESTPIGTSCLPTRTDMPPLQNIPGGPTLPLVLLPGMMVLVAFVNQDPSRPFILSAQITSAALLASVAVGGSTPGPVTIVSPIVVPLVAT
jgi:hypothetical protein